MIVGETCLVDEDGAQRRAAEKEQGGDDAADGRRLGGWRRRHGEGVSVVLERERGRRRRAAERATAVVVHGKTMRSAEALGLASGPRGSWGNVVGGGDEGELDCKQWH